MESRARRSRYNYRAAKYGSRVREFRSKMRRMPNGYSTANVGDMVEMESQGHLFHRVTGDVEIGGEHIESVRHWRCEHWRRPSLMFILSLRCFIEIQDYSKTKTCNLLPLAVDRVRID
ncbi:hypothetical protein Acr_12g0004900 [Actinidia rufa]|uniref:Uncharacterized protein n=1 Tax=Actinidia rufa TaxID=165716 RepID=A0A7J0FIC4_9ERIC|nr:hypothetical protein Acr_12g0004900 [Actinidia rufa]